MIRAGVIQGPFESSQELSRRHQSRKNGSVLHNQRSKWMHKHPVVSVAYFSEEASFHSNLSTYSKKRPFSSPWKYRKLSGDDTVSLINSSMESDDMGWTNHMNHSFSERSHVYDDMAHKQSKMAKIWSLACLLNCPRQKRVPVSSPTTHVQLDRNLPLYDLAESFCEHRIESPLHFDFANFEEQECTFDSTLSPFAEQVLDTSMYSSDLFSDPDDKSDTSNSHGSLDEIVKEQHEFAQMLEFWLKQSQKTVERDCNNESFVLGGVANANTNEDKENSNCVVAVDETIIALDHTACGEQVDQNPSLVRTGSCSSNGSDVLQSANDPIAEDTREHVAEEKVLNDPADGDTAVLKNSEGQIRSSCSSSLQGSVEIGGVLEAPVSPMQAISTNQDVHDQENATTEPDKADTSKQNRGHIENLIQFWNKSEPKRLGKPRCSLALEADEDASSACPDGFNNDLLSRLTASRIQVSHRHDPSRVSMVNDEDWISRLTVSRTRYSENYSKNADSSESTSAMNQTTASSLASTKELQMDPPLHQKEEEEISFWSPRLFDSLNVSSNASACSSHRDDCTLLSVKSDSSVSWFGMVGLNSISDDSSIRRRLRNYKADQDPEDVDFEESRQRSSPPFMLDEIDNLVTQLSNDYVEALSGLEISGENL